MQSYPHGEIALVLDCRDLSRMAEFWCAALGYEAVGGAEPYNSLLPAGRPGLELLLQRVPEDKGGKNRLHLDLRTPDLASEVARVVALGASLLTDEPVREGGWTWHVLADPEGNEFCVLQPPDNHWDAQDRQA
jgi:predicted enzyme related to lactoylglutathione lyase